METTIVYHHPCEHARYEKLAEVSREYGNTLYRVYAGIIFPYSSPPLTASKKTQAITSQYITIPYFGVSYL